MDCDTDRIPKPVLKGLHGRQSMKNLAGALLASMSGALIFYVLVSRKRKEKYRAFYTRYCADAAFKRMVKHGIFSSVEK